MSIVEFDGLPSWFLDTSETGESTKCPWVGAVEGKAGGIFFPPLHPHAFNLTATTHGNFVLSPVSFTEK